VINWHLFGIMSFSMLTQIPTEVLCGSLVSVSTADLVRTSLTCTQLYRFLFSNKDASSNAMVVLATLGRDAAMLAQHRPCSQGEHGAREGCEAQLHSLGLPLRICSAYCAAMLKVVFPQAVHYEAPVEIEALLTAHRRLQETSPAKRRSGLGTLLPLGPPVGSLLSSGEVWAVTEFVFEVPSSDEVPAGELARSQWHWLEVPRVSRHTAGSDQQAQETLRLGVQLQADVTLGTCLRPEMRCVLATPTTAWVVLQAVAASPGISFELGLAAGGFDAYGHVDSGRYFPREEYSWRSPPKESVEVKGRSDQHNEMEVLDEASNPSLLGIRVLLLVHSATRSPAFGRRMRVTPGAHSVSEL